MNKQSKDYAIKNDRQLLNHEEKIIDTINPIIYKEKNPINS